MSMEDLKTKIRHRYGNAAEAAASGQTACCSPSCGCDDPITSNLYEAAETAGIPQEAVRASLGCGNPTALASLEPGQTVLDLGSGGGIDVLLSARRVGPAGKVYGLDMTDQMLELARSNQRRSGLENVEFLKGEIEDIPLPDQSIDVIISNCVINLSAGKDQVFREAFRVLKPGGRLAVSDVVVRGTVPDALRRSLELWIGCIAGALEEETYRHKLQAAGFQQIDIEPTRIYRLEDAETFLHQADIDVESVRDAIEGRLMSAFIRARRPGEVLRS